MTDFGDQLRIVKVGWKGKGGRKLRTHPSAPRGVGAEVKIATLNPRMWGGKSGHMGWAERRKKRPHRVGGTAAAAADGRTDGTAETNLGTDIYSKRIRKRTS